MKRGLNFFVVVLVVGAVLGSLLGEILGQIFPSGTLHAVFSRGASIGISPFTVYLLIFELTLGLMLKLNLCAVIGLAAAFLYLRR
jgi:H+/Cl- antiporter ClcA